MLLAHKLVGDGKALDLELVPVSVSAVSLLTAESLVNDPSFCSHSSFLFCKQELIACRSAVDVTRVRDINFH